MRDDRLVRADRRRWIRDVLPSFDHDYVLLSHPFVATWRRCRPMVKQLTDGRARAAFKRPATINGRVADGYYCPNRMKVTTSP